jgi:nitrite reductase/ring-hydroxylating ferredoxin subunit
LWQQDLLAHCEPLAGQPDGVFKVRVTDYPALAEAYGSVRLGLNPVYPDNTFPNGDFYPILINRGASDDYYVLDCECRHEGCVVPTFSTSEFCIQCQCHGSQYDIDGSLISGPAGNALYDYPFERDGDVLTIQVSCWGFKVQAQPLPSGPNARLRIDFTASPNVTYKVNFSQSPRGPWTTASFATTAGGPLNQTSLTTAGGTVSVFLNRPTATGFFAVEMELTSV